MNKAFVNPGQTTTEEEFSPRITNLESLNSNHHRYVMPLPEISQKDLKPWMNPEQSMLRSERIFDRFFSEGDPSISRK